MCSVLLLPCVGCAISFPPELHSLVLHLLSVFLSVRCVLPHPSLRFACFSILFTLMYISSLVLYFLASSNKVESFESIFAPASLHLGSLLPATHSKPDSETHLKEADDSLVLWGRNTVSFTSSDTMDTCLVLAVYFAAWCNPLYFNWWRFLVPRLWRWRARVFSTCMDTALILKAISTLGLNLRYAVCLIYCGITRKCKCLAVNYPIILEHLKLLNVGID